MKASTRPPPGSRSPTELEPAAHAPVLVDAPQKRLELLNGSLRGHETKLQELTNRLGHGRIVHALLKLGLRHRVDLPAVLASHVVDERITLRGGADFTVRLPLSLLGQELLVPLG